MTSPAEAGPNGHAAASADADASHLGYRPDLDGLRAVAIIAVVLFHAEITGAAGGFVGVDVFLVLSGWLITRQVTAPVISDGSRPNLIDFWLRRIRRLLPAMAVMVALTYVASVVIFSPMELSRVAQRGAAATTYTSNLLFALRGGDYFGSALQTSPYLHTWSLSLEEQFYLVWPILIGAVALLAARSSVAGRRRLLLCALGAVTVLSFAANLYLVGRNPQWAYFLLPGRMWQFAIGGLAAVALPRRIGFAPRALAIMPVAGLAAIVASVVSFDSSTAFPGTAALLPVAGTLLVICGNQSADGANGPVAKVLSLRPVVGLGRLAYSWYLWHWPFMVLGSALFLKDWVLPGASSPALRLALGVASLGPAMLSLRYVEAPFRSKRWVARRGATVLVAGATSVLLLGAAFALHRYGNATLQREPYRTYQAVDRSFEHQPCRDEVVASRPVCIAGAEDGSKTVVLAGDSHAWHWVTAFSEAAESLDIRLVVRFEGNCAAVPTGRSNACGRYTAGTMSLIEDIEPDGVVFSDARSSRWHHFDSPEAWADAYLDATDRVASTGARVGHVIDNPDTESPMVCLGRGGSEERCSPSASAAMARPLVFAQAEARAQGSDAGAPVLDALDGMCGRDRCDLRSGGVWRFAGTSHLSEQYTLSRLDDISELLVQITAQDG